MDQSSREILQKTMQFLYSKGYKVLSEFALPNKKRVDIIAINSKKKIIIVEVKSNKKDFKLDKKWKNYLNYCNYFFFASNEKFINFKFKSEVGLIEKKGNCIKITKKPKYNLISDRKKNSLIFKMALSAASKFHRLIDPEFNKKKNNSIYIYSKKK